MTTPRTLSLFSLPDELILHSLESLTLREIINAASTCKSMNEFKKTLVSDFEKLSPQQKLLFAAQDEIAGLLAIKNQEVKNGLTEATLLKLCKKHKKIRKYVLNEDVDLISLLRPHQIQDLNYLDAPRPKKTGFSRFR